MSFKLWLSSAGRERKFYGECELEYEWVRFENRVKVRKGDLGNQQHVDKIEKME